MFTCHHEVNIGALIIKTLSGPVCHDPSTFGTEFSGITKANEMDIYTMSWGYLSDPQRHSAVESGLIWVSFTSSSSVSSIYPYSGRPIRSQFVLEVRHIAWQGYILVLVKGSGVDVRKS